MEKPNSIHSAKAKAGTIALDESTTKPSYHWRSRCRRVSLGHGYAYFPNLTYPYGLTQKVSTEALWLYSEAFVCIHTLPHLCVRSGKADRRAEHNAIERARRESLNVKFQQLAHALPNLQDDRRPSKSRIVEKALEWVRQTFHREQQYRHEIQQLRLENERLRALLSNKTMKGSFTEIEVPHIQSDTNMLSFNNWSSLSNEYLFDPSVRTDDLPFSEQHDDDDNSSNEGDYESEHNVSFYGKYIEINSTLICP
jgi:hypothetical protein